jgi:geranylgeranyl diphosphate synthase, type I
LNLDAALQPYISQVDEEIKKYLTTPEPANLYNAVRHLFQAGGKRLRPVMSLISAQAVGGESSLVLPYAAAIEMLHTFTLIHDDIMDHSLKRRGQDSVHAKYGEATAILAGDVLIAQAYDTLADLKVSPELFREIIQDFSAMTREICEGQQYDVEFEKMKRVEELKYFHMVERKTATFYEVAMKHGALIAGGDAVAARKLSEAGRLIGLAFQVWDDCLDLVGDVAKTGKPAHMDVLNGKKTLIVVYAMDKLDPLDRRKLIDLIATKDKTDEDVAAIMKFFEKSKAIAQAQDKARSFSSHAKACLAALPPSNARNLLTEIAQFAVTRDR